MVNIFYNASDWYNLYRYEEGFETENRLNGLISALSLETYYKDGDIEKKILIEMPQLVTMAISGDFIYPISKTKINNVDNDLVRITFDNGAPKANKAARDAYVAGTATYTKSFYE